MTELSYTITEPIDAPYTMRESHSGGYVYQLKNPDGSLKPGQKWYATKDEAIAAAERAVARLRKKK